MVRTAFVLVSFLCLLFLSQSAQAQQPAPRSYLFLEVADSAGHAVGDATIRVLQLEGKEIATEKTGNDGKINTTFHRDGRQRHYDLQILKTGYLPYESVLFPLVPYERYFTRLTEEIPNTQPPLDYGTGPSIKITLSPAALRTTEAEAKQQQLLLATKRGDALSVKKLLEQSVKPDAADAKGVPAIAWATFAGEPETIRALLDAGANVRKQTNLAREALLLYLAEGLQRNHVNVEIINKLIEAGADVNASNSYHGTVLNRAILLVPHTLSIETIKALMKAGADVNAADKWGQTPFLLAARQDQKEVLDLLLSAGAKRSLHAKDHEGRSAIFYASSGHRDLTLPIFKVLLENGAKVNDADNAGVTPLMMASRAGAIEIVQALLTAGALINAKDKQRLTALMFAVTDSYTPDAKITETVKLLLAAGAQINDVDVHGRSALMYGVRASSDQELIKVLLAAGAKVNIIDTENQTALQFAVKRYSTEIVQALLKAGVASTINTKDNQGSTALLYAAELGNTEIITALIAAGALVDEVNAKGETSLIITVKRNHAEAVKALLAARASANIRDKSGNTALVYAKAIDVGPEAEIFNALIAAGADPNHLNEDGDTLLIVAASSRSNTATIRALLNTDAKRTINTRNKRGESALLIATAYSEPETVALLLAAGANVNEADNNGQTALMRAVSKYEQSLDLVKHLIKAGANVNATDSRGQTALLYFRPYEANDLVRSVFKELIAAGANVDAADAEGKTQLLSFAQTRSAPLVQMAIDAGANVNAKDKRLRTALFYAFPFQGIVAGTEDVVRTLIAAGANPNVADQDGNTPLMLAAHQQSLESVGILLAAGADVNAKDKFGHSALMDAAVALESRDSTFVVKTLIRAKANVDDTDELGQTALMSAARTGYVKTVEALLEAGASVKVKDKEGKTALIHATDESRQVTTNVVQALIAAGANVNETDARRQTPLMLAALRNALDSVTMLLKAGAKVNAEDQDEMTPLMFAAWGGGDSSLEITKALLNAKAKVNESDKEGKSVLMFAAQYGPVELVRFLLSARAAVNARNDQGESPLMFVMKSMRSDNSEVEKVKLLLQAGADVKVTDKEGQTPLALAQKRGFAGVVKLLEEAIR